MQKLVLIIGMIFNVCPILAMERSLTLARVGNSLVRPDGKTLEDLSLNMLLDTHPKVIDATFYSEFAEMVSRTKLTGQFCFTNLKLTKGFWDANIKLPKKVLENCFIVSVKNGRCKERNPTKDDIRVLSSAIEDGKHNWSYFRPVHITHNNDENNKEDVFTIEIGVAWAPLYLEMLKSSEQDNYESDEEWAEGDRLIAKFNQLLAKISAELEESQGFLSNEIPYHYESSDLTRVSTEKPVDTAVLIGSNIGEVSHIMAQQQTEPVMGIELDTNMNQLERFKQPAPQGTIVWLKNKVHGVYALCAENPKKAIALTVIMGVASWVCYNFKSSPQINEPSMCNVLPSIPNVLPSVTTASLEQAYDEVHRRLRQQLTRHHHSLAYCYEHGFLNNAVVPASTLLRWITDTAKMKKHWAGQ